MARTLKDGLRRRAGRHLKVESAAFLWLVECAGLLMTRMAVGEDGKTAYERIKGQRWREEMVEFGEKVLYEVGEAVRRREGKAEARFRGGICLGFRGVSGGRWV